MQGSAEVTGAKAVARANRQFKTLLVRALNRAAPARLNYQLSLLSPPATVSLGDCIFVICAVSSASASELG